MTLRNVDVPLGVVRPAPAAPAEPKAKKTPPEAVELLQHFYKRFREVHGYSYKGNWPKDLMLVGKFWQRYGSESRLIVDYLFDVREGRWGSRKEVQTTGLFAQGAEWVVVQLRDEMMQSTRVGEDKGYGSNTEADEFVEMFRAG